MHNQTMPYGAPATLRDALDVRRPATGPRVIGWLRASIVAAIVLPAVLFIAVSSSRYGSVVEESAARVDRAARIANEHAARVIETNEVITRQTMLTLGNRTDAQVLADTTMNDYLRQLALGVAQIQSIWVWDRNGHPLATNLRLPDGVPRSLDISDREYFRALREPGASWFVSQRLNSRTTGEAFFDIARRREDANGNFSGVVSVSLRPEYFSSFYAKLAVSEPGLAVLLVRSDGAFISRWPEVKQDELKTTASDELLQVLRSGVSETTFHGLSPMDGQRRFAVARKLDRFPLYVVASIERQQMLASWYRFVLLLASFTFPTALALAYVCWVALRFTRREIGAMQRLQAESDQRQRAEEALRQAQKLEALGHLTGSVAHDFNNLLMIVQNSLHLHTRLLPEAAQTKPVDAIFRAVDAGAKLTRQLLAFSRRQALRPTVIDIRHALPAISELVRTTVGRGIAVTEHVAADVPRIEVDGAELELAMLNLAINARDAMAPGGRLAIVARRAEVQERPDPARDFAVISLSDTGRGAPAEVVQRAFEPFFTTKGPGHGTGLGLSQVYGFCAQAGGIAKMESQTGLGTTVQLLLPATEKPADSPVSAPRVPEHSLQGHVLFVEDNLELAAATQPLIERLGCSVMHVPSADAALQAVTRMPRPDIVVSDIVMPGSINGLDLALLLRARQPLLPIVLMTGYAAEIQRAVAAGFELLPKPVSAQSLAQTLARLLPADDRQPNDISA